MNSTKELTLEERLQGIQSKLEAAKIAMAYALEKATQAVKIAQDEIAGAKSENQKWAEKIEEEAGL